MSQCVTNAGLKSAEKNRGNDCNYIIFSMVFPRMKKSRIILDNGII